MGNCFQNIDKVQSLIHPFILIRHGQSTHNERANQICKKFGDNFKSTAQYKQLKYSSQLLDGCLTQKGKQQATNAIKHINFSQIDLVVVSPLRRAIQTCQIVFKGQNHIKFYVQPLMAEMMSSAVDISVSLKALKQTYNGRYNFQRIAEGIQQKWFFELIKNKQTVKLLEQRIQKQNKHFNEIILETMKTNPLQNNLELRQRSQKLKLQLIQYAKISKKKVALVGHSYMFQNLTATQFDNIGKPVNGAFLQNCQVRQVNIRLK